LKEGKYLAILAVGWTVHQALKAAEELEKFGISAEVVNARFVKPLDEEVLKEVAEKFEVIVTVEENAVLGGFGSAVNEFLSSFYSGKIYNLGIPDRFIEHGNQNLLRKLVGIDSEGIFNFVKEKL
jgi:1-deoxy-D-xylulose-5-phosphate synthase